MKSKFFLITIAIVLIALAYFAFPIAKERYFNNEPKKIINQAETTTTDSGNNFEEKESADSPESPIANNNDTPKEPVSQSDCEAECSGYDMEKDKTACLEECALTNASQEESDCAQLSGTIKDSCWKEKALKEKNFSACDNIESASLKKSCQDRLTEELLDSGPSL